MSNSNVFIIANGDFLSFSAHFDLIIFLVFFLLTYQTNTASTISIKFIRWPDVASCYPGPLFKSESWALLFPKAFIKMHIWDPSISFHGIMRSWMATIFWKNLAPNHNIGPNEQPISLAEHNSLSYIFKQIAPAWHRDIQHITSAGLPLRPYEIHSLNGI